MVSAVQAEYLEASGSGRSRGLPADMFEACRAYVLEELQVRMLMTVEPLCLCDCPVCPVHASPYLASVLAALRVCDNFAPAVFSACMMSWSAVAAARVLPQQRVLRGVPQARRLPVEDHQALPSRLHALQRPARQGRRVLRDTHSLRGQRSSAQRV